MTISAERAQSSISQVQAYRMELDSLHKRNAQLERELRERDSYIENIRAEISSNLQLRQKFQDDLKLKQKEVDSLLALLHEKRKSLEAREVVILQEADKSKREKVQLDELKRKIDSELKAREEILREYELSLKNKQQMVESVEKKLGGHMNKEKIQKEIFSLQKTLLQKDEELKKHNSLLKQYMEKYEDSKTNLEIKKREIEKLYGELKSKENALMKHQEALTKKSDEIAEKERSFQDLRKKLNLEISGKEEKLKAYEIQLKKEEADLDDRRKMMFSMQTNSGSSSLEREVSTLREEIKKHKSLLSMNEVELAKLKTNYTKLEAELAKKEKEIAKKQAYLEDVDKKNEEVKKTNSQESEKIKKKLAELSAREESIAKIEATRKELVDKKTEYENAKKETEAKKSFLDRLEKEYNLKKDAADKLSGDLEQKQLQLQRNLDMQKDASLKLNRTIEEHRLTLDVVKSKEAEVSKTEAELKKARKMLEDEHKVALQKIEKQLQLKEKQIIEKHSETSNLLKSKEKELKNRELSLKKFNEEIDSMKKSLDASASALNVEKLGLEGIRKELQLKLAGIEAKEKMVIQSDSNTVASKVKAEEMLKKLKEREEDLNKKELELASLQKEISSKEASAKELKKSLEADHSKKSLALISSLKKREDEIISKYEVASKALGQKEKIIESREKSLVDLEKQLIVLKDELEKEIARSRVDKSKLNGIKTDLNQRLASVTAREAVLFKQDKETLTRRLKSEELLKKVLVKDMDLTEKESLLNKRERQFELLSAKKQKSAQDFRDSMMNDVESKSRLLAAKEKALTQYDKTLKQLRSSLTLEKSSLRTDRIKLNKDLDRIEFLKKDIESKDRAIYNADRKSLTNKLISQELIKKLSEKENLLDQKESELSKLEHHLTSRDKLGGNLINEANLLKRKSMLNLSRADIILKKEEETLKKIKLLDNKEKTLAELESSLSSKESELSDRESELKVKEEMLNKNLSKTVDVSKKEDLLERKQNEMEREQKLVTYMSGLLEKKQKSIRTAIANFNADKADWIKREQEVKEMLTELEAKKNELDQDIQSRIVELEQLNKEWKEKEDYLGSVKSAIAKDKSDVNLRLSQLKEGIASLEGDRLALKKEVKRYSTRKKELQDYEKSLLKKYNELTKKEQLLSSKNSLLENKEVKLLEDKKAYEADLVRIEKNSMYSKNTADVKRENTYQRSLNSKLKKEYDIMQKAYKQNLFSLKMKESKLTDYENSLIERATKLTELIEKLNRKESALNKKESLLQEEFNILDQKKWKAYVESELQRDEEIKAIRDAVFVRKVNTANTQSKIKQHNEKVLATMSEDQVKDLVDSSVSDDDFAGKLKASTANPRGTSVIRNIDEMVSDTRKMIAMSDFSSAGKMIGRIESELMKVSSDSEKKRLSYDLLELKTDIKLASL